MPATWLAHLIGRPLIDINFQLQRNEANFRYSLVRLRENAEGVALYRGEGGRVREFPRALRQRDRHLVEKDDQAEAARLVPVFYGQLAIIFPFLVASPRFFAGSMPLGGIFQIASRVRPGAERAVLVHQRLHQLRQLEGDGGSPDRFH